MSNTKTNDLGRQDTPFPRDAGRIIKMERKRLGLSRAELAERIHLSDEMVAKVELLKSFSSYAIAKMRDALNEVLRKRGDALILSGRPLRRDDQSWLTFPEREWDPAWCGPGALLNADFRVVPFHGERRLKERDKLVEWCGSGDRCRMRLFTGAGGVGKTRLSLEVCRTLRKESERWVAGFLDESYFPVDRDPWLSVEAGDKKLLVVVDYAGDKAKTACVDNLLQHVRTCPALSLRVIFLERDDLWLGRFQKNKENRSLVDSPFADSDFQVSLAPVATSKTDRENSFTHALRAFAERLGSEIPKNRVPPLSGQLYERVLLIHMRALLKLYGVVEPAKEKSILHHVLNREREYWRCRADARGLSDHFLPAIEEAVYWIAVNKRPIVTIAEAKNIISKIECLSDQPKIVVHQIALLLKECYPYRKRGIAPIKPDGLRDILGEEHLLYKNPGHP